MATLLLVEDDEVFRHTLFEVLEKAGYDVIPVAQGGTAVDILERHPGIHLLITAVNIPVMSGLDLLVWKDSAPRYEQIPGIVLATDEQSAGGYARKYALVRKPIAYDLLLRTVERLCRASPRRN